MSGEVFVCVLEAAAPCVCVCVRVRIRLLLCCHGRSALGAARVESGCALHAAHRDHRASDACACVSMQVINKVPCGGRCEPLTPSLTVRACGAQYVHSLGMSTEWAFTDVWGLDEELLAMLPQPVLALILLFPITSEVRRPDVVCLSALILPMTSMSSSDARPMSASLPRASKYRSACSSCGRPLKTPVAQSPLSTPWPTISTVSQSVRMCHFPGSMLITVCGSHPTVLAALGDGSLKQFIENAACAPCHDLCAHRRSLW
jgi:hypothetical protein